MTEQKHPIEYLSARYPQLLIPLEERASFTPLYRKLVLRGEKSSLSLSGFSLSKEDALSSWDTPAGQAEVLYLRERADFERCVCALAYRCESRSIPPSMGAITVSGLINWEKIRSHRDAYEKAGGTDWPSEFKRFTSDASRYRDALIIVSDGNYSAVEPEAMHLCAQTWRALSLRIRIYHELTHFVCRRLYPGDVDPIRDEVIADAIGIIAAFGSYDPEKGKLFLGIEGDAYRRGGRLENYRTEGDPMEELVQEARFWIDWIAMALGDDSFEDPFAPVHRLMTARNL